MNKGFLIYSASAGSGKTFRLAVQYITLLVQTRDTNAFEHTLAVTFTNKATAEMKGRILEQLYGIWKSDKDSEAYLEEVMKSLQENSEGALVPDREEIRIRCGKALRQILHNYSHFHVSTIDSFFQIILHNLARELRLCANLQVELGEDAILDNAVDNILDEMDKNGSTYKWVESIIQDKMAEEGNWDVRSGIKKMAYLIYNEAYLTRKGKPFTYGNLKIYKEGLLKAYSILTQKVHELKEQILQRTEGLELSKNFINQINKLGEKDFKGFLTGKTIYSVAEGKGLLTAAAKKKLSDGEIESLHNEAWSCIEQMIRYAIKMLSIQLVLQTIRPMGLLEDIDTEVNRIHKENNQFALAKTALFLNQIIEESDTPFIYEKIGSRFHNIMIDEFQDTGRLQWENFKPLLKETMDNQGINMLVGDIKQSIYRWRNGDWSILKDLADKKKFEGKYEVTLKDLNTNFRSGENIVTFNNDFFQKASEAMDTLHTSNQEEIAATYKNEEIYSSGKQKFAEKNKRKGYVRMVLSPKNNENWTEQMLGDLCDTIEGLRKNVPLSEMAIIVRKKNVINELITFMANRLPDVKLVSDEAFQLSYSVSVEMIVCTLRIINSKKENKEASIEECYLRKLYSRNVLQEETDDPQSYCSNDIPELTDFLNRNWDNMPLADLCETIYRELKLNTIEGQDAYLFAFFDELSLFLHKSASDITSFLEYWDATLCEKAIPGSSLDGIRIFTIHKSKGLQFHTVFMPYCDWDLEKDKNDLLWCTTNDPEIGELGTLPIKKTSQAELSAFRRAYTQEHRQTCTDELNALYVAFTRAELNLFVWGKQNKFGAPSENAADLIAQSVDFPKGEKDANLEYIKGKQPECFVRKDPKKKSTNRMAMDSDDTLRSEMCSFPGNIQFQQSRAASEFLQEEEDDTKKAVKERINKGKLLHYIFSKIETADDIGRVTDEMKEEGILNEVQRAEAFTLASEGIKNKNVQEWFSGKYELFNECNILVKENGKLIHRRPDRVMTDDTKILVVDFKFGKHYESYVAQVQNYMNELREMMPQKTVTGYLWYPFTQQIKEIK